jgi:hypothetical protein
MRKSKLDSDQPWRNSAGLTFAFASELIGHTPTCLDATDQSPLASAIREAFPDSNPIYWAMIARRFRELFKSLPEEDAALAVSMGFSSPDAAMRARVIRKRKYIGFAGVRS